MEKQMKNRDKTLKHLQELLERIPRVREAGVDSTEFKQWREESRVVIRHAFGKDSDQLKTFNKTRFSSVVWSGNFTDSDYQRFFERGLETAKATLNVMIIEVRDYWPSDDAIESGARTDVADTSNRKVFVIHGHDEAAKHELARFLKQLDLDPVLLGEQPSRSNTVIEKLEEYAAAVSYAVALLTADDVGSPRQESTTQPRARQNVIFELGYFIGQLGRDHVCALTKGKPEILSNYSGVVYVPMDSGEWKIALAKELDKAEFDIDMNKLKQ